MDKSLNLALRTNSRKALELLLRGVPFGVLDPIRSSFAKAAKGSTRERVHKGVLEVLRHRGVPAQLETFSPLDNPTITIANADSLIVQRLFWLGEKAGWEPGVLRWWRHFCSRSTKILELGANIGYFTVQGALAKGDAEYTAVEPHPGAAGLLRKNLSLNNLHHVQIVEAAAVAKWVPHIDLHLQPADHFSEAPCSAHISSSATPPDHGGRSLRVETVSMPAIFEGVDLLKIDVEGEEYRLLNSVFARLVETGPTLFLEMLEGTAELRSLICDLCSRTEYRCYVPTIEGMVLLETERIPEISLEACFGTRDIVLTTATDVDGLDQSSGFGAQPEHGKATQGSDRRHKGARPRLALLVNTLAPTRRAMYSHVAEEFDLDILTGGAEGEKIAWQPVTHLEGARVSPVWGWTLRQSSRRRQAYDPRALHIEPGYLLHLIRVRPDVVVSWEMGVRTLQALLYGTATSTPVWVWWGGTAITERDIGRPRRMLRRLIVRWCRRWFSYGETSTQYLLSLGIPRDRIVEITHSVDEQLFVDQGETALDPQRMPHLLYAGRLVGRKGLEELIRAAGRAEKRGREFALTVVGTGPEKEKLLDLVNDVGVQSVEFRSSFPYEQMPGVYRSADCVIFPTLMDQWGLVVNESLLCGTPVACSKYAGCLELVDERAIFDPLDPEDFDRVFDLAIAGRIPKRPRKAIPTARSCAETMIDALKVGLGSGSNRG